MEVHILLECTSQEDFTEGNHFSSAAPAREIVGVYGEWMKANEEKERLESLLESGADEEEYSAEIYYEIESYKVAVNTFTAASREDRR